MIPFSFFLLIPGAELLLPLWLSVFPNSLPSQFISETDRINNFYKRKEKQIVAVEKLAVYWPVSFSKLLKDPNLEEEDRPAIKELRHMFRNKKALPTDLLQYRWIFKKYGSFKQFNTKSLIHVCEFMSHEPVTGLNTINRVIKMPLNLIQKLTKVRMPKLELKHDQNRFLNAYVKYFVVRDIELLF